MVPPDLAPNPVVLEAELSAEEEASAGEEEEGMPPASSAYSTTVEQGGALPKRVRLWKKTTSPTAAQQGYNWQRTGPG